MKNKTAKISMRGLAPKYVVIETVGVMGFEPVSRIIAECEFEADAKAVRDRNWRGKCDHLFEVLRTNEIKITSVQTDAGLQARIVTSKAGNSMPAARMPEKCDGLNSGTGAD